MTDRNRRREDPGTLAARTAVLAGQILLENGGETRRAEDTMARICRAAGAVVTDCYATPGMLMVSFTWQGRMIHNMKRVASGGTDLDKIMAANALSRALCAGKLDMADCLERLQRIKEAPGPGRLRLAAGAFLAGSGFALVFGANLAEAAAAGVVATAGALVQKWLSGRLGTGATLLCSGFMTLCGLAAGQAGGFRAELVTLSALMILVPGMLFTTALRECAAGDLLSGQARFSAAILQAAAIALGNIGCLLLTGAV